MSLIIDRQTVEKLSSEHGIPFMVGFACEKDFSDSVIFWREKYDKYTHKVIKRVLCYKEHDEVFTGKPCVVVERAVVTGTTKTQCFFFSWKAALNHMESIKL